MVRYGILGFGHHAEKRLVPAFLGAKDSKLAGLWRRDFAKAQANARDFKIEHAFETPESLCSSPEIDAVFVASPDALHLHDVLLALQHGKPVLCEKPLAMSAAEVETMLAAQAKAGVALGVAQNMRYNASIDLAREWIAAGRIGEPLLAHAQFCYPAERSPRQWIYDPTLALGGPIGDVAIHCIDALRFVLSGENVTEVSTLAHTDADSGAVESHAVVGLGFASGAMGSVTVTTRGEYRSLVEVTGKTGVIVCENGMTVFHDVDVIRYRNGQVAERVTVSNVDSYSRMLDSFSAEVEGTGTYLASGMDGLHNQRILDAAYASWRSGMKQVVRPGAFAKADENTEVIEIDGKEVKTLKELLRPGLRAVFVGLNPPPISVERGHYYQGKLGQRFWSRLRKHFVGLELPKGREDLAAFEAGYGFIDLVRRPTKSAKELKKPEKLAGVQRLIDCLEKLGDRPCIVFTFGEAWNFAAESLTAAGYKVCKMPGPYAGTDAVDNEMKKLMMELECL